MIKKISKIDNLGVFSNPHSIGGRNFKERVIIYGKNKKGKSTLTSLFRSLMMKESSFISHKKTFNSTTDIRVEIDFDGATSTFRNNTWENPSIINPIYIFDSIFVHDNVYQGESVSNGNEDNLNNLILGVTGRKFQSEINKLTQDIGKIASDKTRISREITTSFGIGLNINALTLLKQTHTDYTSIKKEFQDKISQNQKKNNIQKDLITLIRLLTLNKKGVEMVLGETVIVDIDGMKNHISHTKPTKRVESLDFMEKGLGLLEDTKPRNCVFCGQILGDNEEDLLQIFADYFNGRYREVRDKVKGIKNTFKALDLPELDKWILKLKDAYNLDIRGFLNTENYEELVNKVIAEIDKKSRDLSYTVDFSVFNAYYEQIAEYINSIQSLHDGYNDSANNLLALNAGLKNIITEEKRFSKEWIEKLEVYGKLDGESTAITTKRSKLLTDFNTYCEDISNNYTANINARLSELQADFRLCKISPLTGIRKQNDLYELKINENIIKINGDTQNFSNSLSESDKRILAFAFFLSTLPENIEDSIIIFDDPINSLDHERKRITSSIIGSLTNAGQIIILTHDREFLRTVSKDPGFHDHKFLEIQKGPNGSATLIDSVSVEDIVEDESRKLTKCVHTWSADGVIPDDYEKNCRRLIELIFEIKHHDKVKHRV